MLHAPYADPLAFFPFPKFKSVVASVRLAVILIWIAGVLS